MEYRRDDRNDGGDDETQENDAVHELDDDEAAHDRAEKTEGKRQRYGEVGNYVYGIAEVAFGSAEKPFFSQPAVIYNEESRESERKAGIDACKRRTDTEQFGKGGKTDENSRGGDIGSHETRLSFKRRSGLVEIAYEPLQQELQTFGLFFEFRNDENADDNAGDQYNRRAEECGIQRRVDFESEEVRELIRKGACQHCKHCIPSLLTQKSRSGHFNRYPIIIQYNFRNVSL